ncbi:hypothetical protein CDV55_106137 [Aspergillus turcosus]|nr:hypothetical protein CDV55_106137 [Aspergillus turcosus]
MSILADPVDISLSQKVKGAAALRANEPPSPDGDFRCGICHKSYSRRDLRDRHRRRCIKTAGQERTSKRKSCETCAQKKVRCSMTRPACARCVQTGTPCHYPPASVPANPAAAAAAAVAAKNSTDSINHNRSIPKAPSSCASSGSPSTPLSLRDGSRRDSIAGLNLSPDVSSAATPLGDLPASLSTLSEVAFPHLQQCHPQEPLDPLLSPWSPMPTSTNIHQILRPFADSTLFAPHDLFAVDALPWVDDLSPLSEHFSRDATLDAAWLLPPLMPLHDLSKNPLNASPTLSMMEDPFQLAGGMVISSEPDSLWHNSLPQSVEDESPQLSEQLSEQLTFGHNFLPPSGELSTHEANDLYQELLQLIRQLPALLREPDFWSPFLHHQLYRGALGGTAKPLGIALACVSAHGSSGQGSSTDNDGFVDRMINQEREKLVCNFPLYTDTPETSLAALHAVCIYQILGLFGESESYEGTGDESESAAKLHSSFLLEMTRHLYNLHKDALLVHHEHENDWTRWKFTESLRRNIFFVHIISILGGRARARKLTEEYVESLGDEMVLHLPLPAPEYMWRAGSEEEWLLAREQALTARQYALSQTLHQLLQMDRTGGLDVSALLPVTRMVLACSKIAPGSSDHCH